MMASRRDGPKMGHHTGSSVRGRPSQLPPQAASRAHTQYARIQERYQHAWEFSGHPGGIPETEYGALVAACNDFPSNARNVKFFQVGPTMTVFAEESEE